MIDTGTKVVIFRLIELSVYGLWFFRWSKTLGSWARVFWTLVLIFFFAPIDMTLTCNAGLGCLGIFIVFGAPFGISALAVLSVVIHKSALVISGFIDRKARSRKLPGPEWIWIVVIGLITFVMFELFPLVYSYVLTRRR